MKRILSLLCLAVLPTMLQAQDERPKIDPAQREALRERAAEIKKQVEALRGELRGLRGQEQEPDAKSKPPRRGKRERGQQPPRGERPPGDHRPPRGERPPQGEGPRRREGAEHGALPHRFEELRERFQAAAPMQRRMMWMRLQRMRGARGMEQGPRHEGPRPEARRGAEERREGPRELPRPPFRRR